MEIQVGPESSISTPSAGYRTLFINTDKNNILYYKLPDGTFEPFTGDSDGNIDEIAEAWTRAVTCSLSKSIITPAEFEAIMAQGITVLKQNNTDSAGNTSNIISVGSRVTILNNITLDSYAVTLAPAGTHQVVVTFNPTTVSNQGLTYSSTSPSKATVSSTGLITYVATGSADIVVIPSADPSKYRIVNVTTT